MQDTEAKNVDAVDIKFKESEVSLNDNTGNDDGNETLITRNSEDNDKQEMMMRYT